MSHGRLADRSTRGRKPLVPVQPDSDDNSDDLGSSDSSYSTESSETTDTMDDFVVPDSQGEGVQETEAASAVDSPSPFLSSLERIGPAVDNLVRVLTDLRIESSFAIATQNQTWCCCHHRQAFPRRRSDGSQVFSPLAFDDLGIHPALRERGDGFQD